MYRKHRRQAASTGRDRMGDKARQTLQPEEDLANGTVSDVHDNLRDRPHERLICQIPLRFRDLAVCERHGEVIEDGPTVHEECADRHEATAELRVLNHDAPITVMLCIQPIVFNVLNAFANIVLATNYRVVLDHCYHAKAQRSGEFQRIVEIFDLERNVHDTRDEEEADHTGADYVHQRVHGSFCP